jgi:ankyrin repeat protein
MNDSGRHTLEFDFTGYGYVGGAIEQRNLSEVKRLLGLQVYRDPKTLEPTWAQYQNKSLLNLALDNINNFANPLDEAQLQTSFDIIDTLLTSSNMYEERGRVSDNGESLISGMLDLLKQHNANPDVKNYLLRKINEISAVEADKEEFLEPLLRSNELVDEINTLKAYQSELNGVFANGFNAISIDNLVIDRLLEEQRFDKIIELAKSKKTKGVLLEKLETADPVSKKSMLEDFHKRKTPAYPAGLVMEVEEKLIGNGTPIVGFDYLGKVIKSKSKPLLGLLVDNGRMSELLSEKEAGNNIKRIYELGFVGKKDDADYYQDIFINMVNKGMLKNHMDTQLVNGGLISTSVTLRSFLIDNLDLLENPVEVLKGITLTDAEVDKISKVQKEETLKAEIYKGVFLDLYSEKRLSTSLNKKFDELDQYELTRLQRSCFMGEVETAKKLLAVNVDPFTPKNSKGLDAVAMLGISNNPEASRQIFQAMLATEGFAEKIRLEQEKSGGFYYAMLAIKKGNIALADSLLEVANPEQIKKIQSEVFYRAVKSDDSQLLENFFKLKSSNDFKPNSVDIAGKTQNMMAMALNGEGNAFQAIIESGNPNVKIDASLLETAVTTGRSEATIKLLNLNNQRRSIMDVSGSIRDETSGQHKNILNKAYEAKSKLEIELDGLEKALPIANATAKGKLKTRIDTIEKQISGIYKSMDIMLSHNVNASDSSSKLDVNESLTINLNANHSSGSKDNVLTAGYKEVLEARSKISEIGPLSEINKELFEKNKSILKRREGLVNSIIKRDDVDLNIPNELGQNLLMLAAEAGDSIMVGNIVTKSKLVSSIIELDDIDLNIPNELGQNLFVPAAEAGDSIMVGNILTRSDSVKSRNDGWSKALNSVDSLGNSAIFYAAQAGKGGTFGLLVDEGSELRGNNNQLIVNQEGVTPLMAACSGGHIQVIKYINPTSEDCIQVDKKGNNSAHYLAMGTVGTEKSAEILETLLKGNVNIDVKNKDGRSPLTLAVLNNNVELVNNLLSKGADVNGADKLGNTPLLYACLLNDETMIKTVLTANRLDINHKNNSGVSAFMISAQRDGLENMKSDQKTKMLGKLDLINDRIKDTPGISEGNSYKDLTKVLIKKGAEPFESGPVSLADNMVRVGTSLAVAKAAALSSQFVANSIPVYGGIASEVLKFGTSMAAATVVRNAVKDTVKSSIISFFSDGTDLDKRLDLSGEVMIGSFVDRGFGSIQHGNSLATGISKHSNFENMEDAIFTKEVLQETISLHPSHEWFAQTHEALTDKYKAVQNTIEKQPWYYTFPLTWKGIGLNNVAKEILQADKILHGGPKEFFKAEITGAGGKRSSRSFEDEFGKGDNNLIDTIRSPKLSNQLLRSSIEDPLKTKEILDTIHKVVNKEITVAPDTYYHFEKFVEAEKKVTRTEKEKSEFIGKKSFFGYELNTPLKELPTLNNEIKDQFVENRKTFMSGLSSNQTAKEQKQAKPPAMILSGLQWITGAKDANLLRNNIANTIAETIGDAAGVATAAQLDPHAKAAVNQASAAGFSTVANIVSTATTAMGFVTSNPVTSIAVASVAGASAYVYQNRQSIGENISYGASWMSSWWNKEPEKVQVQATNTKTARSLEVDTTSLLDNLTPKIPKRKLSLDQTIDTVVAGYSLEADKAKLKQEAIKLGKGLVRGGVDSAIADRIVLSELERGGSISETSPEADHKAALEKAEFLTQADTLLRNSSNKVRSIDEIILTFEPEDREHLKAAAFRAVDALKASGIGENAAKKFIASELERTVEAADNAVDKHNLAVKETGFLGKFTKMILVDRGGRSQDSSFGS